MIVYLDAGALVKRFIAATGSPEVGALIGAVQAIGTAVISRAEVAAAIAKATRIGLVARDAGAKALQVFNTDWEHVVRLQLNEPLVARAAVLAWEQGPRGYDSVHLASALAWSEALGETVAVATYDRELWRGAKASGLSVWPAGRP